MVDTINPSTGQPDLPAEGQPVAEPSTPESRFYGGFDKPDETKINLADTAQPATAPTPSEPVTSAPVASQPVHDVNPVQPSEVKHTSYVNSAEAVNWRGVMVIAAIGILATLLVGLGVYFGVSAMNSTKIKEQQTKLDGLQSELTALEESPTPLELPKVETPTTPTVTAPVVAPVVTPTPIETPQTTTPAAADDGSKTAAG